MTNPGQDVSQPGPALRIDGENSKTLVQKNCQFRIMVQVPTKNCYKGRWGSRRAFGTQNKEYGNLQIMDIGQTIALNDNRFEREANKIGNQKKKSVRQNRRKT